MIYLSVKIDRIVLGITGTNGAGKGTIVDFLVKEEAFEHFSASGLITEEIIKRKMPVNREMMIMVANDLRTKFGVRFYCRGTTQTSSKVSKEDSNREY